MEFREMKMKIFSTFILLAFFTNTLVGQVEIEWKTAKNEKQDFSNIVFRTLSVSSDTAVRFVAYNQSNKLYKLKLSKILPLEKGQDGNSSNFFVKDIFGINEKLLAYQLLVLNFNDEQTKLFNLEGFDNITIVVKILQFKDLIEQEREFFKDQLKITGKDNKELRMIRYKYKHKGIEGEFTLCVIKDVDIEEQANQ